MRGPGQGRGTWPWEAASSGPGAQLALCPHPEARFPENSLPLAFLRVPRLPSKPCCGPSAWETFDQHLGSDQMEFSVCDGSDVSTRPGAGAPGLTAGHTAGVSTWSIASSLRGLGWTHVHPPLWLPFLSPGLPGPSQGPAPLPWGVPTKKALCPHVPWAHKPPPALETPDELVLGV